MPADDDYQELRETVAKQGAYQSGLKNEVHSLRGDLHTLVTKIDAIISSTRPNTIAILTVIGGAVAIVLTATQIVLALTVSPIRTAVGDIDKRLDKRGDLMLEMKEDIAENNALSKDANDDLESYESHVKELHEQAKVNQEEWRIEYLKEFRELRARMDKSEAANAACLQDRKGIRSWMEKIDNTGTRNQINR